GKINAARYAREHKIPYLGLCLGMQVATIEFARNVCGIKDANSTEFQKNTPEAVISLLEEQRGVRNKGASMRLDTWPTQLGQSKPNKPHPLFKGFIQACLARQAGRATHARGDQESPRRVPDRELVPQR